MTPEERREPDLLLEQSRRERVARGAGVSAADVGELLAQRQGAVTMFRQMSGEEDSTRYLY